MAAGGLELHLDARDLAAMYKALHALGTALTVELRRGVKDASAPIVRGAKQRAAFSRQIPRSIRAKPNFSTRNPSVAVVATARNAAPLNNKGRAGRFRHPVYPRPTETRSEWTWVSQEAHPFMDPPPADRDAAERAVLNVMDSVARKAGFR